MRNRIAGIGVFLLAAFATIASASSHEHEDEHGHHRERERRSQGRDRNSAAETTYRKECGACHVAYAPFLLPAASWQKLLRGLDQHFGQDASLEPEVRASLESWLQVASGGERKRSHDSSRWDAEGTGRITDAAWFRREHRRIGPEIVRRPSVKTMSNCTACHRTAADWSFDEHAVMIPAE